MQATNKIELVHKIKPVPLTGQMSRIIHELPVSQTMFIQTRTGMFSVRTRVEAGKIVQIPAGNGNNPVTNPRIRNKPEMRRPVSRVSNVRVAIIPAEVQVNQDQVVDQGLVVAVVAEEDKVSLI